MGVAASAGGPAALGEVLGALPANFGLPVLVVQHISDGSAAGLAEWLDALVAVPVRVARDGEPAGSGVAIAPDGAHLLLQPMAGSSSIAGWSAARTAHQPTSCCGRWPRQPAAMPSPSS